MIKKTNELEVYIDNLHEHMLCLKSIVEFLL